MMTEQIETAPTDSSDTIRACQVSSIGFNIHYFFRGQFAYLQARGFHYTVITTDPTRELLGIPPETAYYSVPLKRSISPWTDVCSLWKLVRVFRKHRFDLVQYTTAKAALLGSIAAFLARSPVRLYLVWGLYYVAQSGLKRRIFKAMDWLAFRLSTHVTFDGFDIRAFAIADGLCTPANSSVVGEGSDNGISLEDYDPVALAASGRTIRRDMGIPDEAIVIGSIMRLVGDKGVNELAAAFDRIAAADPRVWLLLVARVEDRDPPRPETLEILNRHPRIARTSFKDDIRAYYCAMDIFCLPTYREGFSAVNLEAAAMTLPVVTTDAIGAKESIVDGETGIAVAVKDVERLVEALKTLIDDAELRARMGLAGRRRVEAKFEQQRFWADLRRHREDLLIARGLFRRVGDRLRRT